MTQKIKARSAGTKGPNTGLVALFRPYALPPTRLHAAIQAAAREAGWVPPWAIAARKSKTQMAGKNSGAARARRADIRRHFVKVAFDQLKPFIEGSHIQTTQLTPLGGNTVNYWPKTVRIPTC
jgi:hypothetical protein